MLSCRKGEWGQANVAYNSPQTLRKENMDSVIRDIEEKYPECIDELLQNFDKAYKLWCRKQSDYGDGNIKLGLDISSTKPTTNTHDLLLAQLGIVIRMNDKIQRLLNIHKKSIFNGEELSVSDESIDDTCIDLMNYANMLIVLKNDKWGK